jgi:hypothetical protein
MNKNIFYYILQSKRKKINELLNKNYIKKSNSF